MCNDVLVCYKSSLNKPGQLFIIKMHSVNGNYDFRDVSVHEISPSKSLPNSNDFVVEHSFTAFSKLQLNGSYIAAASVHNRSQYLIWFIDKPTIFYGPKDNKCPLIVWPHGGPHSGSLDTYLTDAAFFVQAGN